MQAVASFSDNTGDNGLQQSCLPALVRQEDDLWDIISKQQAAEEFDMKGVDITQEHCMQAMNPLQHQARYQGLRNE